MKNNKMPDMPSLKVADSMSTELEVPSKEGASDLIAPDHALVKPITESFEEKSNSSIVAPKISKSGIEVVALRNGFYNQHRLVEGNVFVVKSFEDLGEWMKCIDPDLQKKHLENLKNKKAKK